MLPQNFTTAHERICQLAETFRANEGHYLSAGYQEAEARQEFIDKFWQALGWDVYHEAQPDPYRREVRIEKAVKVGGRGKRADYAFYVGPDYQNARFLCEAKKPSRNLDNAQDYWQTIRYGWNSATPLAVLTDFEQLRVLDCRYKPDLNTSLFRKVREFHYTDYADAEKFREIYYLLSREAVGNGALENFTVKLPKTRGKEAAKVFAAGKIQQVDESFLADLDGYREQLARAFKRVHHELDGDELTEITQRALDRLVFMRFLEDKQVEQDALIGALGAATGDAWRDFLAQSRRLDKIYNGIIFKPHALLDDAQNAPDARSFNDIRDALAAVNSPYDFNLIPLHILGSIYERFLGKTITVTEQRARVEEKPEVRKAGGVYYTPAYIVNYIVENTVGQLIAGRTPEEIAALRFADIACGSGSFLLGVFACLIRYHVDYYSRTKQLRQRALKSGAARETAEGVLQLSITHKREILLNNIYGVDVDAQAVEVAQLSLYLKLLEEETVSTAQGYLQGFREALLPTLDKNVVAGNSLIDFDIMDGLLFDGKDLRKLNPMSFAEAFPHVMRAGGFDAIVGNPPYVRMESFKPLKSYLRARYASHDERSDLYAYFIEQANKLLKDGGKYGVIVSNKFLRANYGSPLRNFLAKKTSVERIVDFAGLPVFIGATVRTIVLITSPKNGAARATLYTPPLPFEQFQKVQSGSVDVAEAIQATTYEVPATALAKSVWSFSKGGADDLLDALKARHVSLAEYSQGKICMGIKSGLTEAFMIDADKRAEILSENPAAAEIIKPFLNGRDVRRYQLESKNLFLIYTYHGVELGKYPAVAKHLAPFKDKLNKRATKQAWYELQQPQFKFAPYLDGPKIIFPDIATTPRFALDEQGYYGSNTIYFIPRKDLYLLALLNSRFGFFYFSQTCAGLEGKGETYLRFFGQYLEGFPVRRINFADKGEKAAHDRIVSLVEQMLAAKRSLAAARTDGDKRLYERMCASLDGQLDALVYQLYGLAEADIALIEG